MSDQDKKSKPTKRGADVIRKPVGGSARKHHRISDEAFTVIDKSFPSYSNHTTVANSFAPPIEENVDKNGNPKKD